MDAAPPLIDAVARVLGAVHADADVRFVRTLTGGAHAETVVVEVAGRQLVARRFPPADDAVVREVRVLDHLRTHGGLEGLIPEIVAHGDVDGAGIVVTTLLDGGVPASDADPRRLATEMAEVLARIHAIPGGDLPPGPGPIRADTRPGADAGPCPIALLAEQLPPDPSAPEDRVVVHHDFWTGNALWRGSGADVALTGVVDWSDARSGPRGVDVAWCRQDLALLGAPEAADFLLATYEEAAGVRLRDIRAWDARAGAHADPRVEEWAPNYAGIGRPDITGAVLRERLDAWNATILDARG